ncbi:MAG: DUF1501 domain-containing protein [Proteobacteria bacterium]|nr:DUF1501 domain-containing protein [Pseudomonadota bacterium]
MNTKTVQPLSRRGFLLGATALTVGGSLPRVLFARTAGGARGQGIAAGASSPRLVVVILRGALDGLAAVPPYGDPHYADLHQDLAIGKPGSAGALDLDGHFGLHPSLAFLHERYLAHELAVIHAVSSPYRERSHFDGQAVIENGLTSNQGSADGWLNRTLAAWPAAPGHHGAERALGVGQNLPLILRGPEEVMSRAAQPEPDADDDLLMRLADLYADDPWFSSRLSRAVDSQRLAPSMGAGSGRGSRLDKSATLAGTILALPDGPDIAVFDATGWDTHANQGGASGNLARHLSGLDDALKTLASTLGDRWSRTAVVVVTEFGRTAAMNGTRGTDHGTGTCCFVLGGAIAGGRVITDWPGLGPKDLFQGRDLRPTRDLRSVFKSVLGDHLQVPAEALEASVFPDSRSAGPLKGLIRGA